jgi:hypothetical protein
MQLFLFTFAPVTRRCAELLLCVTVPAAGGETTRLVIDLSRECWTGAHLTAAIAALCLLFIYTIIIPAVLLHRTRRHKHRYDLQTPMEAEVEA